MLLNLNSSFSKFAVTLISRLVSALVGIIFVPLYVKLIGIESYGMVAFYSTLVGTLSFLDLGLSTAISRQVSIQRAQKDEWKETHDLVFSVEIIYWIIAIILGILIIFLSPFIAEHWVKADKLSNASIRQAVLLMGLIFIFQFPMSIYNGIMIGLEKQIPNAVITMVFSVLKAVGVIFVLSFFEASIEVYFIWQAIITILFIFLLRYFAWKGFPSSNIKASFSIVQIKKIWRFAAGITGISIITFFIMQIDKLIVSKMVMLEFVGYYNLAFLIAGSLNQIISPIQPVIFPKFSTYFATNNVQALSQLYHKTAKWIAIIIFPIGGILVLFANEIILAWSHNPILTANTAPIAQICVIGTICNCMMWAPYLFLLAKGNTRFTIYQNLIVVAIITPLLYYLTRNYGIKGASFVWLFVNVGYVLISIPIFHNFFLKGELLRWYKNDIALPFFVSAILITGAKLIQLRFNLTLDIFSLTALVFIVMTLYVFIIPEFRMLFYRFIKIKLT